MMDCRDYMKEHYEAAGKDLGAFRETLGWMAAHTAVKRIPARECFIHTVMDITEPGNIDTVRHSLGEGGKVVSRPDRIPVEKVCGDFDCGHPMVLETPEGYMMTTVHMMPTMALRVGLGNAVCRPSMERDRYLARLMCQSGSSFSFTVHEMGGYQKAFAVLGSQYTYIPQTAMLDVIDQIAREGKMGRMETVRWKINPDITSLAVVFPDVYEDMLATYHLKEDMDLMPGLVLASSDTSDSAFTVKGVWMSGTGYGILQDEVRKTHRGGRIDPRSLCGAVDRKIFHEYRNVPEKLARLMGIDLYCDTDTAGEKLGKVRDHVEGLLHFIDIGSAIGKRQAEKLAGELAFEVDLSIPHTAYDLVMSVISVPGRVEGISELQKERIMKAVKGALDYGFELEEVLLAA